MNRVITLLILLGTSSALADAGLDQLKQSFSGLIQSSAVQFEKAAAMRPTDIGVGTEISKEACDALAVKIKLNYKVDPFQFVYENGSSINGMCGGRWGWQKNFVQNKAGTSNMGLPYSMVIQLQGADDWDDVISNYFIDAAYRIVEIQGLSVSRQTKELIGYGITSIDSASNTYISVFDKKYSITGGLAQDVTGTHTMEQYIPTDGSIDLPLFRRTVKHPSDSSKDYRVMAWHRTDKKDWEDFQLPITFADFGGFYLYDGKWYSAFEKPTFKSSLTIKYRGGKEYCADGSIKADQDWVKYPANETDYYNCINY